ncbi:MAG: flavocytochrome c [Oscillibacter sp.]|nr:flavocytochrome c [Oscillibacter sp.]
MKEPITKNQWIRGVIAGVCAVVILLGLEAIGNGLHSATAPSVDANIVGEYQPGTYAASANGFGGPVEVTLTVGENGGITDAAITGASETPDVGGAAIPDLSAQLLSAQSAEIDGVSGATFTTNAVKEAAAAALAEASGIELLSGPKAEEGNLFIPGYYDGVSMGFGGDVTVTVKVSENSIDFIDIEGDHETENIGSFAVSMLGDRILAAQTPNIDALTGATVTSGAILRALKQALTEAGADLSAFPDAKQPEIASADKEEKTLEADIVIIGAGGAGMTAAIHAVEAGKDVILLEKMPYAGGNTTKATGGMNAAETHYQAEQNIEDTVSQFIEDTINGGHGLNNRDLVTIMAQKSAEGIEWLDSINAPLPKVSFSGGATNARIHSPEDGSGVGAYLVTAFLKKMDELGVNVMYDTKATELIKTDGAITGVKAEDKTTKYDISAKAVILTTGGFGCNEDMIVKYKPELKGTVKTGSPGATGDGIVMAEEIGAALVDIEQIQLHPTVEQSTSMLITEGVRGDGAILVNQSGKRFINELLTRDVVSAGELEQEGQYAYIIFDQKLRDGLKAIEKYVSIGITTQADTIEELAEKLNIDPATLSETLKNWNQYVADKNDPDFGRDTGMEEDLSTPPYYAIKVAPGIHHTMGGVKIDTDAEVIDTKNAVIPGLFAAGEVTGGVHGGNRIGGTAVTDIVVFGTIASDSAVKYCDN